ncbi:MAG: hypothetical protein LLG01_03600 [Planctomycetaceae bacterium]|nr:hypothetical protein [Planctomycetaceae bacterium]
MRRKRLQSVADTLCQMFCGWRLVNSYHELAKMGSGQLLIDVITSECVFREQPIASLVIAQELQLWLQRELNSNRIPIEALSSAQLRAHLELSIVQSKKRITTVHHMNSQGKPVQTGIFFRLAIECDSEIKTDEASYKASMTDVEEWPENWP